MGEENDQHSILRDPQWRNFLDAIPRLVVVFEYRQGKFYYAYHNNVANLLSGAAASQRLGQTLREILPDATDIHVAFGECLRSKTPKRVEVPFTFAATNLEHILRADLCFIEPNIVLAHVEDITDSKSGEAALKESTALLNQAQKMAHIGSWTWDIQSGQVQWSQAMYSIVGRDLLLPAPTLEELPAYFEPESWKRLELALENIVAEHTPYLLDLTMRGADGAVKRVSTRGQAIANDDGTVTRLYGTIQDVTDQEELKNQLVQSQKMEMVGTLASGVAHDMNNVLAVVLGIGSILEEEIELSDPHHQDIDDIMTAAKQGKSMVEGLLSFARTAVQKRKEESLNALAIHAIDILEKATAKRITISTEFDSGLADVSCDANQMIHVIMNVCLNAVDAVGDDGTLLLRTLNVVLGANEAKRYPKAKPGKYVLLQIIDNGIGMKPHVLERAYEPFFTTKSVGEGTGLGLFMAYSAVENHGGFLALESIEGMGTKISVYLPQRQDAKTTAASPPLDAGEFSKGNGETILIIDDEKLIRTMSKRLLTSLGYEVLTADSGQSGIDLFEKQAAEISFVLLDLAMPEMDGKACFEKLRGIDPDAKILICTGHGSPQETTSLIQAGAAGILLKPFERDALAQAVRSGLGETRLDN